MENIFVHWDADIVTTDDVVLVVYREDITTGAIEPFAYADAVRILVSE